MDDGISISLIIHGNISRPDILLYPRWERPLGKVVYIGLTYRHAEQKTGNERSKHILIKENLKSTYKRNGKAQILGSLSS